MHPFPGQAVEVCRQRGHKRFPFPGRHFRDPPFMQNDPAQKLNIIMPHPQRAFRRLPDRRKGFRQNIRQHRLPVFFQFLLSRGQLDIQVIPFFIRCGLPEALFNLIQILPGGCRRLPVTLAEFLCFGPKLLIRIFFKLRFQSVNPGNGLAHPLDGGNRRQRQVRRQINIDFRL